VNLSLKCYSHNGCPLVLIFVLLLKLSSIVAGGNCYRQMAILYQNSGLQL
jgi:hypothetical protein